MELEVTDVGDIDLPADAGEVVILPTNPADDAGKFTYSTSAPTFFKYAKDKAPIRYMTPPEALIERRSGDWFAPTLLLTQKLIHDHPMIFSVVLGVFTNFLTDFFKGQLTPKINIDLVIETKRGSKSKFVRQKTRCTPDELADLMERVKEIANGDQ